MARPFGLSLVVLIVCLFTAGSSKATLVDEVAAAKFVSGSTVVDFGEVTVDGGVEFVQDLGVGGSFSADFSPDSTTGPGA